jgi:hypothetical protein
MNETLEKLTMAEQCAETLLLDVQMAHHYAIRDNAYLALALQDAIQEAKRLQDRLSLLRSMFPKS